MSIPSHTRLGRYEIRSQLGAGGMGEVYLAQDLKLERAVALKILPAEVASDPKRMQRFVQEAKAASALNHPNIITIHEIDVTDSVSFIATEYITGSTLRHSVAHGRMTPAEAVDVAIQVASALAAAHEAGIIHRDIKPENVMIRRDGIVKVLDFGLAKLSDRPISSIDPDAATRALVYTAPGTVMGTACYMSPEQARGVEVDARTDIWSLGVMLYEMVAGRTPFSGGTPTDVIAEIVKVQQPPLTRFAPEVSSKLEEIVSKALEKDREDRYQGIKDLLVDLRRLKKRLDFETEMERSAAPEKSPTVAVSTGSGAQPPTVPSADAVPATKNELTRPSFRVTALAAGVLLVIVGITLVYRSIRRSDPTPRFSTLAVLPFKPIAYADRDESLELGMADTLIRRLSGSGKIAVRPFNAVRKYAGLEQDPVAAGQELKVDAVLDGNIQRAGDRMRVTVRLVSVRDARELWAKSFEEKFTNIFAVQDAVSQRVAEALALRLSGEEAAGLTKHFTEDADAYRLYLKGEYFWNKFTPEGSNSAVEYFKQAIAQDPTYAAAYASLGKSYAAMGINGWLPPKEAFSKAKAAASKALEIDDQLVEGHAALGATEMFYEWNWSAAERALQRAIDRSPDHPDAHRLYSYLLTATGRFDASIAQTELTLRLDPLSPVSYADVVRAYYFAGRYDEAVEANRKAFEMEPNFAIAHIVAGAAYEQKGMYEQAVAELQKANNFGVGMPEAMGPLGHTYAVSGKRNEAIKILGDLKEMSKRRYVSPLDFAILYAGLGDKEKALEYLEKAAEDHAGWLINLKVEPRFAGLRTEPRYSDLTRRLGLAP